MIRVNLCTKFNQFIAIDNIFTEQENHDESRDFQFAYGDPFYAWLVKSTLIAPFFDRIFSELSHLIKTYLYNSHHDLTNNTRLVDR